MRCWDMVSLWLTAALAGSYAEQGVGTGRDGDLTFQGDVVLPRGTPLLSPVTAGEPGMRLGSVDGIDVGTLLLVWKVFDDDVVPSGPVDALALGAAGRIVWGRVTQVNVAASAVEVDPPLPELDAIGTQVIAVPEYTTITLPKGVTVSAPPWDGATGGLVVMMATERIALDGVIEASAAGFPGGPRNRGDLNGGCEGDDDSDSGFKGGGVLASATNQGRGNVANGGGGGSCTNAGGGGGGNGGAGGLGGRSWDFGRDVGGRSGSALPVVNDDRLWLGGGGGGGEENDGADSAGGAGGGAVLLLTRRLLGAGTIFANGGSAANADGDGGGGGGAGGSLVVRTLEPIACGGSSLQGGAGGSTDEVLLSEHGPGGGGGGGRVDVAPIDSTSPPCSTNVAGGDNGLVSGNNNGAEPGAPGLLITSPDVGFLDADKDGAYARIDDCDDDDPLAYEGAIEQCNGRDDDCDGMVDEGCETEPTDTGATDTDTGIPTDTGDTATGPLPTDDAPEGRALQGCRCDSGPDAAGWIALVLPLLARRRR